MRCEVLCENTGQNEKDTVAKGLPMLKVGVLKTISHSLSEFAILPN